MEVPPGSPSVSPKPTDSIRRLSPQTLRRHLLLDTLLRRGTLLIGMGVLFIALLTDLGGGPLTVALILLGAGWVALGLEAAKVVRELPTLAVALDHEPAKGEALLATLLRRKGLPRWVRLTLYHRAAAQRHRQGRYAEAAALAQELIDTPGPGTFRGARTNLLLLLLEARLELRDAWGAWAVVCELAGRPMGLNEALQRMALRTRWELMVGQQAAALNLAEQKMRLAELMPAPQCGAFHAMLATAAERDGQPQRAAAWWAKVHLLCTPEQIKLLRAGV